MDAVIIPEGSLKEFRVPEDILSAFKAESCLPSPIKLDPLTAPEAVKEDTLIAEGNLRLLRVPDEILSAFNPVIPEPLPAKLVTLIAEGNLRLFRVPEDILSAFVVSVVADGANPLTAPDAIAILVLVAPVTLPYVSVVMTGTDEAEP